MQVNSIMSMAIDYALSTRLNLVTDGVELGRALFILLQDFDESVMRWLNGEDPFSDCHARPQGYPDNRTLVETAAKRFGLL